MHICTTSSSLFLPTQIKGFLPGLDAADLAKIPKEVFKDAAKSIAESCQKINAFAEDQLEAMEKQVKDAFGDAATFTEAAVEEMGGMLGSLDEEDLKKITKKACKKIKRAAIKMMGGKKAARAFTTDTLKEFSDEAKAAFNGPDLKALGDEAIDKLKAVVCNPDCPGAITDFTVAHDGAQSDDEILTQFKQVLGTASTGSLWVLQAATPMATNTRRRLLKQGRLLAGSSATQQTVVRTETTSNKDAAAAATAGNSIPGSTSTTVSVDAQDDPNAGPGYNIEDDVPTNTKTTGISTMIIGAAAGGGGFVLIMVVIILVAVIVRNKRQQAGARSHDLPAARAESRHVQMNNMPTATVMGGMNDNPMNKPMGMDKQASQVSGRKMPTATVI